MDFHYTLLENGLDFVLSSLDHLTAASDFGQNADARKRHLKYALIHLCSGIELIFKERLRLEDWRLVFKDPDKADQEVYESGDFESVFFKSLLKRLEEECLVELTPQQKTDLTSFRNRRNKVEHFGVSDTLVAVQSRTSLMVSFLVDFIDQNFERDQVDEQEAVVADIRAKLGTCRAVVDERWALIQAEVESLHSVVICPSCRLRALGADGGDVRCVFCHYSAPPEDAAHDFVANVLGHASRYGIEKDGGEWPIRNCPECGDESFVTEIPGPFDSHDFYCFSCGVEYGAGEMETCNYCGEPYDHTDAPGSHICPDCFEARASRDN